MSDVISMLKAKTIDVKNANGPARHILNDRLADLGQVAWDYGDEIISALKTVRGIEGNPHVIDEDHAYGDQEIYYGVLTETNFVEGDQSVIKLVACVSEESAYLSDNHGDLRDIDEFDFVVGPFKK